MTTTMPCVGQTYRRSSRMAWAGDGQRGWEVTVYEFTITTIDAFNLAYRIDRIISRENVAPHNPGGQLQAGDPGGYSLPCFAECLASGEVTAV